jgi:hypothetical protein
MISAFSRCSSEIPVSTAARFASKKAAAAVFQVDYKPKRKRKKSNTDKQTENGKCSLKFFPFFVFRFPFSILLDFIFLEIFRFPFSVFH